MRTYPARLPRALAVCVMGLLVASCAPRPSVSPAPRMFVMHATPGAVWDELLGAFTAAGLTPAVAQREAGLLVSAPTVALRERHLAGTSSPELFDCGETFGMSNAAGPVRAVVTARVAAMADSTQLTVYTEATLPGDGRWVSDTACRSRGTLEHILAAHVRNALTAARR